MKLPFPRLNPDPVSLETFGRLKAEGPAAVEDPRRFRDPERNAFFAGERA